MNLCIEPSQERASGHADARSSGAPRLLTILAVAAAGFCGAVPRAVAQENWANDTLKTMQAERVQTDGERGRRPSAVERMADRSDDDEMRPQRKAQGDRDGRRRATRGTRVASLGREVAPAPARLPPAAQNARPPEQKKGVPAGKRLGPLVASLGRDMLAPAPLQQRPAKKDRIGPMVASLGRDFVAPAPSLEPSLSDGPINWVASAGCLAGALRKVLADLAASFGPVKVNSTCRSRRHNARVGGAKRSYHLTGNAADFRVGASPKAVHDFLRGNRVVGGLKHYGFGLFHIDTGPRRSW